jgi:IMP dehydrogenase
MEIEIGRGKKARRAYGFDDIAIVPSRRTRDPDDVDISWKLGPYQFELPMLASAMDGVVSPETAGIIGRSAASPCSTSRASSPATRTPTSSSSASRAAQGPRDARDAGDLREPDQARADRAAHPRDQGTAASSSPRRSRRSASPVPRDRARGRPRRARHPGHRRLRRARLQGLRAAQPEGVHPELDVPVVVGGCASYHTGLHLMRTGAPACSSASAPAHACTTRGVLGIGVPQATAIADAAARSHAHARDRRVRARSSPTAACAPAATSPRRSPRRRRRHDRLAAGARLRGARPRLPLGHGDVPPDAAARRARRDGAERHARGDPLGPAHENDGTFNLFGGCAPRWRPAATRTSPSSTGRGHGRAGAADRGQALQRDQGVGMGATNGKVAQLVND